MGPVCSLSFSFESPATHTKGMCSPASDGPGYRKYLERSHEQEQPQRKIGETEVTVHLSARTCQVSDYGGRHWICTTRNLAEANSEDLGYVKQTYFRETHGGAPWPDIQRDGSSADAGRVFQSSRKAMSGSTRVARFAGM